MVKNIHLVRCKVAIFQEKGEAASKPDSKIEEKVDPEVHQCHWKLLDVEPVEIYLEVLINVRDEEQDEYKKNKSVENEFAFNCLFEVVKQVTLSRRERLRGMAAPNPSYIIEFHYILRKREQFLQSSEGRHRGLFLRSCELIKMLTKVKNLCEQEMESQIQ